MLDVKLLDFGLSRPSEIRTRPLIRGRAGTDPYMPEVWHHLWLRPLVS